MDERPIGIFDSGLGGLSVLKEAMGLMPNERFIYYGDNRNAPYGEKPQSVIKELSFACVELLREKGVKAVVVACNTATSVAVEDMRRRFDFPIISMEPAIKPALAFAGESRVIVLATPATVKQQRYLNLVDALGAEERITNIPCGGLVDIIEGGELSGAKISDKLDELLFGVDTAAAAVVLGCTHYVLAKEAVAAALVRAGIKAALFDGNAGTVAQLKNVLAGKGMLSEGEGGVELYTSGDAERVIPIYKKVMGMER
ncbi:MAG: glutamate racemase [Christensenellales bacterium]|jgi:glutamate racemase